MPGSRPVIDQLNDIDRERSLTEIQARHTGMPAEWIDHARSAGHARQPWAGDRLLPPRGAPARRRSSQRVAADTRQLADMAAISVVREDRLAAIGVRTEPEPAAAMQLRRNMHALWTRARLTAEATAMNRSHRASVFGAAILEVDRRVADYRDHSLDDLNARWRSHAVPAVADGLRRSLKSLRGSTDTLTTSSGDLEPPTPKALIERARHSLLAIQTAPMGSEIESAVSTALPEVPCRSWNNDVRTSTTESSLPAVYSDIGPAP
ncbi:Uncharacterised protein [Nocardia farcinica]|nr:Uncharacterised protein [Nocardia farcinica]